jgi:3-methylcrotonyl-CoA carboxylase alpha subunit
MPLPQKLLIANRGEIACRIARTARQLGIRTVAVYSDADAQSRHVAACDEAVHIGAAAPSASYLRADAIIAAAKGRGADAIHPGYGFLSEDAAFAEGCAEAGITFVGPPPAAMRAMGSKAAAKSLMQAAGVPLTPGYHGENQQPKYLEQQAVGIGFPVLIKASAGGGGKGMRRVDERAAFAAALASCKREALSGFGNDHVIIERYVLRPRHIEIQVFADTLGQCVYLFERDCSVQRRHQKVLEEAPAPGMTAARRAAMGRAAVEAAQAVGYVGAGTVEFIVNPAGEFYFMEMNTRLQVEHPVTEMITGVDLVEWQLRVAMGERLPLSQQQLQIHGHAIEARIYAEDADHGFLPSIGRLVHAAMPTESPSVRIDAGVAQGDEITPFYDAMIAKLIVWGETRAMALVRMRDALEQCQFVGVTTNVAFLHRLVETQSFQNGELDTALIEREQAQLFPAPGSLPREVWLVAAVSVLAQRNPDVANSWHELSSPWSDCSGWRLGARSMRTLQFKSSEFTKTVSVQYRARGWELELDAISTVANARFANATTLDVEFGASHLDATVVVFRDQRHIFVSGNHWIVTVVDALASQIPSASDAGHLRAPMPGRVVSLLVEPGSQVVKGVPLLVLEAMKMEHTILAPGPGRLKDFRVAVGEQVTEGLELLIFEPAV